VSAGLAPAVPVAIVVYAVGGFGNGLDNVATDTIVQRVVPRRLLGRAFGVVYTGAFLGSLIAFGVAGPLVDLIGARASLLLNDLAKQLLSGFAPRLRLCLEALSNPLVDIANNHLRHRFPLSVNAIVLSR
jgi:MFS family permease